MNNYKEGVLSLKKEIKEAAEGSRKFNRIIQGSSGLARQAARREKKGFGHEARYLLLAYTFLRGKAYGTQERVCSEGERPSSSKLLATIKCRSDQGTTSLTIEEIKAWLSPEKQAEFAAANPQPMRQKSVYQRPSAIMAE